MACFIAWCLPWLCVCVCVVVGWLVARFVGVGCVSQLALVGCSVSWLVGCSVSWLQRLLVGRLVR